MDDVADLIRAIAALAWPIMVLVAILLFRNDIAARIRTVRRLKAGPFEGEWDSRSAEVEAQVPPKTPSLEAALGTERRLPVDLYVLARKVPAAAVAGAHAAVESALRDALSLAGQPDVDGVPTGVVQLAGAALERDVISRETYRAIEGITVMRNLAAHQHEQVTEEQALDYLALAETVLYVVENPRPPV